MISFLLIAVALVIVGVIRRQRNVVRISAAIYATTLGVIAFGASAYAGLSAYLGYRETGVAHLPLLHAIGVMLLATGLLVSGFGLAIGWRGARLLATGALILAGILMLILQRWQLESPWLLMGTLLSSVSPIVVGLLLSHPSSIEEPHLGALNVRGGEPPATRERGIRAMSRNLLREVQVYKAVLRDPRTPWLARILLGSGIAYAFSPIDIIPDFIPVLGHLDDAIIVPALIYLGLKVVPKHVVDEHRERVRRDAGDG